MQSNKRHKMTTQEYETKFSEDDAPGWDAIAGALEKIYGPANERHYASRLHASLGGEDYLDGVSIFGLHQRRATIS